MNRINQRNQTNQLKQAITVSQLSHSFGNDPVLSNISFKIPRGDFFIIIGPNGSGKTTLMKIISGIIKPQKGELKILDKTINQYLRKALAQHIAFVPQMTFADFPFTVNEIVLMGRSPYLGMLGLEEKKDQEIAKQAIAFTGLEKLAHRTLDRLSGGEQQRVFIARAICQEPDIILLDEPTASLDLAYQARIMDLMDQLKREKGITIVMVSHDINLGAMYADHLLLLHKGQVMCQGTPDEVITYQNLEAAYGCTVLVDESPLGNFPRITLVPQKYLGDGAENFRLQILD
jgi:iron complex transport system ATP-binding protein